MLVIVFFFLKFPQAEPSREGALENHKEDDDLQRSDKRKGRHQVHSVPGEVGGHHVSCPE